MNLDLRLLVEGIGGQLLKVTCGISFHLRVLLNTGFSISSPVGIHTSLHKDGMPNVLDMSSGIRDCVLLIVVNAARVPRCTEARNRSARVSSAEGLRQPAVRQSYYYGTKVDGFGLIMSLQNGRNLQCDY
ncbi:hypothetical protein Tco_0098424 [Tanacetum coccineum]